MKTFNLEHVSVSYTYRRFICVAEKNYFCHFISNDLLDFDGKLFQTSPPPLLLFPLHQFPVSSYLTVFCTWTWPLCSYFTLAHDIRSCLLQGEASSGFLKVDSVVCSQNGLNALHLASKEGHVNVVTELLKRGANVNAATKVRESTRLLTHAESRSAAERSCKKTLFTSRFHQHDCLCKTKQNANQYKKKFHQKKSHWEIYEWFLRWKLM